MSRVPFTHVFHVSQCQSNLCWQDLNPKCIMEARRVDTCVWVLVKMVANFLMYFRWSLELCCQCCLDDLCATNIDLLFPFYESNCANYAVWQIATSFGQHVLWKWGAHSKCCCGYVTNITLSVVHEQTWNNYYTWKREVFCAVIFSFLIVAARTRYSDTFVL